MIKVACRYFLISRFRIGKYRIPCGCEFGKLGFLGTVRHISQNKYRINILFLVVIQHGINITVYSGSTVMKMQVAHDPEFYAAAAFCGNRRKNKRCENTDSAKKQLRNPVKAFFINHNPFVFYFAQPDIQCCIICIIFRLYFTIFCGL